MLKNSFIHLVKHDIRWKFRHENSSRWWILYAIAAVVIGIIFYSFVILKGNFQPQFLLFFSFGLPFMMFMFGYTIANREWKNQTLGWWLALPYSRFRLLSSKYIVSMMQSLMVSTIAYTAALLFGVYAMILDSSYDLHFLGWLIKLGASVYFLVLCVAPFMVSFGIFTAIVSQSNWRPLVPLLWLGFAFSGNFMGWVLGFYNRDKDPFKNLFNFKNNSETIQYSIHDWGWNPIVLLASLIVGILLIYLSSRIMEKELVL